MKVLLKSLLALVGLLAASAPAAAQPLVDCPLRDKPFSSTSPLIDIMLSPAASKAVDSIYPGLIEKMPPRFASKTPPTFAAILTLREALSMGGRTPPDMAAFDRALAKVPVTRADRIARCARYDVDPPRLAIPRQHPRLLLFEKINGFRDGPSVEGAHKAFVEIAAKKGWGLVTTEKGSAFTSAILRQFDAVIWNNISGDVLTLSQRRAFQDYIDNGGGFVGVHGTAGDPVYFWDWYVDSLLGARFAGHPMNPQFQDARVVVDDPSHPVARGLPREWVMNDEWYSFKNNPRASGSHVIAHLDESTYKPEGFGGSLRMGDHPIAWTRCVGRGRVFYSAIGHRPERYSDAVYRQMLEQATGWAAGLDGKDCKAAK
ncbi:MAG: ThuA domain-containing protein [Novosphingobium sp.]|nr:ThuA domain-containing protein [Novosphingobium sp.]